MFDDIVPCGLEGRAVTSLASELRERDEGDGGEKHTRAVRGVVEARLVEAFAEAFGYDDAEATRVRDDLSRVLVDSVCARRNARRTFVCEENAAAAEVTFVDIVLSRGIARDWARALKRGESAGEG